MKDLNTFRMVPRRVHSLGIRYGPVVGPLDSSWVIYTAGAVQCILEPPKKWHATVTLCCPTQDRGVQLLAFAMVKAKAHVHLPLPSRGTLCLRYCLCKELQPFGEPERVCAAIPRASQLQGGLAHAGFCLPRYVHGCVAV